MCCSFGAALPGSVMLSVDYTPLLLPVVVVVGHSNLQATAFTLCRLFKKPISNAFTIIVYTDMSR